MNEPVPMPSPRAEAAARWLLSLAAEDSAAVVERLSRDTLEEIREALLHLAQPVARHAADPSPVIEAESLDGEPPFLLAALLAVTPAEGRDDLRAAIAERRGTDVLAAIDAFGVVTPSPEATAAILGQLGGRS